MTRDLELVTSSSPILVSPKQRGLLKVFWLIALVLFVFELFFSETISLVSNLAAILITTAALLPAYLWCSGRALGMPIFPLFALTFIWTYALPLVCNHPRVIEYSPDSHLFASLTVTGFLALGTFIWFQFVKSAPPVPKSYLALNPRKGDALFLFALAVGVFFNIYNTSGWSLLEPGIFAILRGVVLGLSTLASFVLSYHAGTKELSKQQYRLFICLLMALIVTSSVSLLLVGAASTILISIAAFSIGRKKIPLLLIIITFICLSFLHYGKGEMRDKYWFGGQDFYIEIWDYPAFYAEWAGYSLNYLLTNQNQNDIALSGSYQEKASFLERSSILHLLLLTQNQSPETKPYLYGLTYAIIPELLVPRIFSSNKIASHEGTYLLNIHYGLQTREGTLRTTIGWGLLAESYANFGLCGCAGLAVLLGFGYGKTTRWTINAPILSAQYLFAAVVMTFAFQTEFSAGVYVAALFQSSVALGGIVVFLMRPYKVQSSDPS